MPATVSHALSMTTPDDPLYENRPSHWNSAHNVTLNVLATEISGLFSNANGVSFGLSGTNITGSIAAGGAPGSVSAGTTNVALGEVVFSNSNGVSFGLNGATVTAQHNALTTAMASNRGSDFVQATAAFAGTSASGTIASGGISVSIGPYITTGMLSNAATISNVRVSGGTTSNLLSAITFANSNGISFGLNAGTMTATVKTDYQSAGAYLTTAALSDHSHGNPTLALTNLTGTTASASNGFTLSLSAAAPGAGGGIAAAAGTQTGTSGTILFNNSNGITFGMSGSTQITASHNGLTTARASNDAVGLNTAQTNVTWTVNSSGISINAGGYLTTAMASNRGSDFVQATAAFAGTNASGTIASNGISVSVAAPGGGAVVTETMWYPYNEALNVVGAVGAGSLIFNPLPANARKEFDRVGMVFTFSNASNSTGSMSLSLYMGFYTKNGSTLSLAHSQSGTQTIQYAGNNSSASNRGVRIVTMPWTTTIVEGFYYAGIMSRTATAGANASLSQMLVSALNSGLSGMMQAATNRSVQWPLGLGIMSVSTAALPASVALANLDGTGTSVARVPTWFAQQGTA